LASMSSTSRSIIFHLSIGVHFLILLIRDWWQLHVVVISQLLFRHLNRWLLGEDCKSSIVLEDLIAIQNLLNDFVIWSWMRKEWVVHFTTSSWIYSEIVTSPLIFQDGLFEVFFVLEVGSFDDGFEQW